MAAAGATRLREAEVPMMIDGEPVLFNCELSDKWMHLRACTCAWAAGQGSLIWAPIYCLFGGEARRAEYESFELYLTPSSLHYKMMIYGGGMCCQRTETKVIPLDKIQDVQLISDCCGDCCGCSEGKEVPWQVHVQTAGTSAVGGDRPRAELVVFCIKEPMVFRNKIMAAKRDLMGHGSSAAAAKTAPGASAGLSSLASPAALATLSRIEALLSEGLDAMRAEAHASQPAAASDDAI